MLALLSKEQGIVALPVMAAIDAFYINNLSLGEAIYSILTSKGSSVQPSVLSAYRIRVFMLATASIGLLLGRLYMNEGGHIILNPFEHLVAFHPSRLVRAMTLAYYAAVNAGLLLYPNHLCCDWSFGTIPLVESLVDHRVIFIVAFFAVVVFLLRAAFGKSENRGALKIALVITILTYLPSSGAFLRVGFVIAERVLYMPRYFALVFVPFY